MTETNKERTKRLIELGGLVKIAELDKIEPDVLLRLLTIAKTTFENMAEEKKMVLKKNGSKILKDRKEKKRIKLDDSNMKNEIRGKNKWLL